MKSPIIYFLILFFSSSLQAQVLDSVQVLNKLENFEFSDDESFRSFDSLLAKYAYKLNTEQQIMYYIKATETAKALQKDTFYLKFSTSYAGFLMIQVNDLEKGFTILKEIEPKIEALNKPKYSGRFFTLEGSYYQIKGDYVNAIKKYMLSYNFYKESSNPKEAKHPLFNVSSIYRGIGDLTNSTKYSRELLRLNKYMKPAERYENTANAYFRISINFDTDADTGEDLDSVSYYLNKALTAVEKIEDKTRHQTLYACCEVYMKAVQVYTRKKDFAKARFYLEKAAPCKGRIEPFYSYSLAAFYLKTGEIDKAGKILNDEPNYQDNLNTKLYRNELLFDYKEKIKDYEGALTVHKELFRTRLEMAQEAKLQYAAFEDARFDASKREEEIKSLKKINEVENLKSRFLLIGALLSLFSLLAVIYALKKIRQNNRFLKEDLKNKEKIAEQAEELKKIDALKNKLFSNIAHELRTPLSLISASTEQLLSTVDLKKSDTKLLTLAKKNSQELLSISNQIMDLTKSEFGEIRVVLNQFYWFDFLEHFLPNMETQIESKGLRFIKKVNQDENILLQTDLLKLKIILNNLFQNAIKFSKNNGSITFETRETEDQLVFSIEDTGTGIAYNDLPYVFQRYYQSKNSLEATGGFGIGLAICQEYITALEGEISIKSEPDKGTVVLVAIPKISPSDQPVSHHTFSTNTIVEEIKALTSNQKNQDQFKLLIVEDNLDVSEFLDTILRDEYDIRFANNGLQALEQLDQFEPDLIITDWMMPIMNGLEFVEKVRVNIRDEKIPILMLTARILPTDQLKALQKGVDDYLLKPFEIPILKQRIEYLLDLAIKRKEGFQEEGENSSTFERYKDNENFLKADKKDIEWISDLEKIILRKVGVFDLKLEDISSELNFSNVHLNRKIKSITGLTAMKFVEEIRFWEARRLLEEKKETSVKAVSYSVGLKSVQNFSLNFKKRFGKSPSEYL